MTVDRSPPGSSPARLSMDESVGQLVSQLTTDLGQLTRQELALAKAELQAEAKKGGKGAGMLGGAAFAGWMVALFVSLPKTLTGKIRRIELREAEAQRVREAETAS